MMTPAIRMTAHERRADVLRVAVHEFAKRGYQGTSTEDVARAAGISQPYLFKMFPTKKALFIALVEHSFERVRQAFVDAVGDEVGDAALVRMGERYGELLRDRDELLLQMQAYAASSDPEIGAVSRREFGRLWREVAQVGALQALFEAGITPDVVVGCSVGALNAAYVAVDPSPQRASDLAELWRRLTRSQIFPDGRFRVAQRLAAREDHLYSRRGLRAVIDNDIGVDDLGETAIPCHVVTTDLLAGEPVWWSSGRIADV